MQNGFNLISQSSFSISQKKPQQAVEFLK